MLRADGVQSLKIDGIEITLRPLVVEQHAPTSTEPVSPRDPVALGFPANTKLPTLRNRNG